MTRSRRWVRAAIFCAGFAALPTIAFGYAGEELALRARVSITEARAIALKTVPGDITDEELETEEGGSGLRYTFNIKQGETTYEVGIDAQTGVVLENIVEDTGRH